MKRIAIKAGPSAIIGLLLSLPTGWVVVISVCQYVFGWDYLFDAEAPMVERLGIHSAGWIFTLLILVGPVLALVLNVLSVLHISFETTKDRIDCRFTISKSWKNLAVVILSSGMLLALFAYALGENCTC